MPPEPAHPMNETDPIIAPLVGRARVAMAAFKDADQARVDEVVTALAWSVYCPDNARALAETAVRDTGLGNVADKITKNQRKTFGTLRDLMPKIYPMQIGYRQHGQSGIAMSDWWPHLARHIDDLAIVRSMWTTDNDHAAQLQFHTCLLYTSPSPRDGLLSRMPSYA